MSKLAYTLPEAAEAVGVSVTSLRQAIDAGDLSVKYPTSRPVIQRTELEEWLESLPDERQ